MNVANQGTLDGSTLKIQKTDGNTTTDLFSIDLSKLNNSSNGNSGSDSSDLETIEGGIVYAPPRWDKLDGSTRGYITGTDISLETYLSSRVNDIAFFDMPYLFHNQSDGNVLGDIFYSIARRKNYVGMHYNALKPAKYHFYIPLSSKATSTCKLVKCKYDNISDFFSAIIYDNYTDYTVAEIPFTTVLTSDETSWESGGYKISLVRYDFTIDENIYGFLVYTDAVLPVPSQSSMETLSYAKYYHLAMNTTIEDPLSYTDTETIKFGQITIDNNNTNSDQGSNNTGTDGNTSISNNNSYPKNVYRKTITIGGDSGTSYGSSEIIEYIKKYCGVIASVRSVAGSKFTGTESGGGIWFAKQYHDVGYPDIVCLCWGGNFDSGGVGSIKENYGQDDTTPTTTLGALRYIVEDIRTVSPDTLILGWIPYQMNLDNSYDSRKTVYDQIREGYKLLGIPIIDAFYESGIVPRDMMAFDGGGIGGDSGHPSSYGRIRIAKLIANTIIRYA